ncbi:hypothetical protein [Deinococcus ruber]|uniref:DUF2141 domain-containing protein n=1 Tax=Deinococcus ruber TaxID=1848197 RepID=A0A918F4T6_9DEIO|nr:hypothetical protein [Deinococcus ruber]GGR08800.1 hypothetical protein GCM10008957_22020 [Deinococcus ruber]
MKTFLISVLLMISPALAHELARDGNVGALMHIEPDDAPAVGKPNGVYFELNQKGGRPIALSQCSCTLSVYAGSAKAGVKPLLTPKLVQAKNELTSTLTFTKPGAYTLVLAGSPKPGATFSTFKLVWTVRADVGGSGGMDMGH